MTDDDCVRFLQWCLPQLGLRWAGYRKVRRTVCKRVSRRMRELGLPDCAAYRQRLAAAPHEWDRLAAFCRIPISRFFRDRGVFEALGREVLPDLARRRTALRAWSAGCASGEEPYSLRLLWDLELQPAFPNCRLEILATDAEPVMLRRAAEARYPAGSLKDLPAGWRDIGFDKKDEEYVLKALFRHDIAFEESDIRETLPAGPFDLVLCRNLAFTYFLADRQRAALQAIDGVLRPGGALVIGTHERLPNDGRLAQAAPHLPIYWKPDRA